MIGAQLELDPVGLFLPKNREGESQATGIKTFRSRLLARDFQAQQKMTRRIMAESVSSRWWIFLLVIWMILQTLNW